MPAPGKRTDVASFDFTGHMARLCDDVTMRHEAFQHIDMSRVAVCFAQARSRALHGLQAKLTPMRFEKGALYTVRNGQRYTVQRVHLSGREMLYLLTFYLPRFLQQSFKEKFVTVLHELYHISAEFDGDIRRFGGRCHVHTHSQKEYDLQMELYAREYMGMNPPRELYEFLTFDYSGLQNRYGSIMGLQVPIPKLIPVRDSRTA